MARRMRPAWPAGRAGTSGECMVHGVVLAVRPGSSMVRCAVGQRWVEAPFWAGDPSWLLGTRVRARIHRRTLLAWQPIVWPTKTELRRRYHRYRSAWGEAEAWLWRRGLPVWQVLDAARRGMLLRWLRGWPPEAIMQLLDNPFAWVNAHWGPPLCRVPFGLWEAACRRLRPVARWPEAWLTARRLVAWRVAIETEFRRDGVRPLDPAILARAAQALLGEPDMPAMPLPDRIGCRIGVDGQWWSAALESRRRVVFERLAGNQRHLWGEWPGLEPSLAEVGRVLGGTEIGAIIGPAGSGKTRLARQLIAGARAAGWRVAVAALTGRAAAAFGEGAQTVHRLLRYGPWGWGVKRLQLDLLVVDEASMLTWDAAAAICEAVRGRLIFLGDPAQLLPVSGERVFDELLARVPVVRLTQGRRAGSAHEVHVVSCETSEDLLAALVATARRWVADGCSWQVLTPYRRGPWGTLRFNRLLQEILNPQGPPLPGSPCRLGDPVILTRPHPPAGAPNGQCGRLVRCGQGGAWLAAGSVDVGPVPVEILEPAYAITIHRAQGSEWDRVLVVCPLTGDRGFIDTRMRYVGLTRSRVETLCLLT